MTHVLSEVRRLWPVARAALPVKYANKRIQSDVEQVCNDKYLQLLHFQAELGTAALHQRVESHIMWAFIGCSQESTGVAANHILFLIKCDARRHWPNKLATSDCSWKRIFGNIQCISIQPAAQKIPFRTNATFLRNLERFLNTIIDIVNEFKLKPDLCRSKLSEQGRVLFHERINFGMPARWMSHCVDNDKTSHNCAVCWNNLPSSLLLPLLNRQLLIVSCNFCSYPLTCCDNFMLMACTPFCEQRTLEQKLQNKRKWSVSSCLNIIPNRPHCTEAQELLPRNAWVLLHSKRTSKKCQYCQSDNEGNAAYMYRSHQMLSLKEEVAEVAETDRPLLKSKGDKETTSATAWTPGDCGCWKLHSSRGTDGADTHLTKPWQIFRDKP